MDLGSCDWQKKVVWNAVATREIGPWVSRGPLGAIGFEVGEVRILSLDSSAVCRTQRKSIPGIGSTS